MTFEKRFEEYLFPECEECKKMLKEYKQKVKDAILNLRNPYPPDIFRWNNPEKLNFNRGRFNKFCFEIYVNAKKDLLKELFGDEK